MRLSWILGGLLGNISFLNGMPRAVYPGYVLGGVVE